MQLQRINAIDAALDMMTRMRNGESVSATDYRNCRGHLRALRSEANRKSANQPLSLPEGIVLTKIYNEAVTAASAKKPRRKTKAVPEEQVQLEL